MMIDPNCPPMTSAQRQELINLVRSGKLIYPKKLMERAQVTPEECFTENALYPDDIRAELEAKGFHAARFERRKDPVDRYTDAVMKYALAAGYKEDEVREKMINSKIFKKRVEAHKNDDVTKTLYIGEDDLKFMSEVIS